MSRCPPVECILRLVGPRPGPRRRLRAGPSIFVTMEHSPTSTRHTADTVSKDLVATSGAEPRAITTRRKLDRTGLAGKRGLVRQDPENRGSSRVLVTRRFKLLRRKRNRLVVTAIAVLLGLFPPVLAVYLVTWLVWRTRPRQKSMRLVKKAIRSLEKRQTGVALKELQDAHYTDPSNCDALYWLGLVLSQQQRHDEAAEALSIVAERIPGLPEVESALVDAYLSADDAPGAVFHAQRLLDTDPYSTDTLLKLAAAFEADGRPDLAIDALEGAPLQKRNLTEDLVAVHYRLGALYEKTGNRSRALHHFKRVYGRDISYRDVRERVESLEREP